MEQRMPEEKRIFMKDFPVKPECLVIRRLLSLDGNEYPFIGKCRVVYSRNPDPGVAISLTTKEEFEQHVGGIHSSIKLSYETSMWAEMVFAKPGEIETIVLHTYELVEEIAKNELVVLGCDENGFFDNHLNIMLHSV